MDVSVRVNSIRIPLNVVCLQLSSLIAHAFSGGEFVSLFKFLAELFVIAFILGAAGQRRLEGPALALLILAIQSSTHIFLGNSSGNSAGMAGAHIAVGAVCYQFISRFEVFWSEFSGFFTRYTKFVVPRNFLQDLSASLETAPVKKLNLFRFDNAFSFRGPPLGVSNA